ncbi:cupin domain-containing protein [Neorhizobium alkalisoli]|uniref:cupin domain-containing protein n=1 Tax=Neorhizobium alkalisoli TaxID=528178 RepID=UPI000CF98015|nr:cupin domain-containing protein [Neorhizobium alkalisoli]
MSWQILAASVAAMAVRHKSYAPEQTPVKAFVGACPDSLEMAPLPIEPSWIISGDPQARAASHSKADDQCAATGVWDCTAGTFRWFFGWDETVVILEGEVHVTAEDGTQSTLRSGDVAYFKGGTWATWRIDNYVRKVAFLRKPFPAPLAALYRLRNMLRPKAQVGLAA